MLEQVITRRHGDNDVVAELVLDRPKAMNALSTQLALTLGQCAAALCEAAHSGAIRTVVLSSSSPKAFCVGADLKERDGFTDADLQAQRVIYRRLVDALRSVPVPIVAAVGGYALGGGFELALNCDLIVADAAAVLALPEVTVGVIPGLGGTQLLQRRIGPARAADLIYTARRLDAHQALAVGAVDYLADSGSAREQALELALRIAANSPVAVRNAKRVMRLGADVGVCAALDVEDAGWRAAAFSPDRREGVRAFVEKRPPVWPTGG